jgi:hypothetical protein
VIRGAVECGHPLRSGHLYLFVAPLANAVTPSRKVTVKRPSEAAINAFTSSAKVTVILKDILCSRLVPDA